MRNHTILRLPYYRWYPSDYAGSFDVRTMTLEEEGAYRRLLDLLWMSTDAPCALRFDETVLAKLLGVDVRTFRRLWVKVGPKFEPIYDGSTKFFTNGKLRELHAEEMEKHAKRVAAGALGGSKRQANAKANARHLPKQMLKHTEYSTQNSELRTQEDRSGRSEDQDPNQSGNGKATAGFWADIIASHEHKISNKADKTLEALLSQHTAQVFVLDALECARGPVDNPPGALCARLAKIHSLEEEPNG